MENTKLSLGYFHAHEAEQFIFYRIPKALFSDERYRSLSGDAKILYGLLLDRMGLSLKNEWLDDDGRVFIYYPLEDVTQILNCGSGKATGLFKELSTIGLIIKKRQGLGKPDLVYVMNFASGPSGVPSSRSGLQNHDNRESRILKIDNQDTRDSRISIIETLESTEPGISNAGFRESHIRKNKTEINKTELNETSSPNPSSGNDRLSCEEEEVKMLFPSIDRDSLIEASRRILSSVTGQENPEPKTAILIDSALDALSALRRENAPDNRHLLEKADSTVMISFVEKIARMDLSGVNNMTAYLKRVLLEFLRKDAATTVSPVSHPCPSASYDICEIERMINEGVDLYDAYSP